MLKKYLLTSPFVTWPQVAKEIGAEVNDSSLFDMPSLTLKTGHWRIELDTTTVNTGGTTVVCTIMRASFLNPSGLRFTMRETSYLGRHINRWLLLQDIQVGHPLIDHRYTIKSPFKEGVQHLFQKEELRDALLKVKAGEFSIRRPPFNWSGDYSFEGDVLQYTRAEIISEGEAIKNLFSLFQVALLALDAFSHPGDPMIDPDDMRFLYKIKDELEENLNWFTPIVERYGEGLQAPVAIEMGEPFSGVLNISPPYFPELEVNLSLKGAVPMGDLSVKMRTLSSLKDRALNVGDDKIEHDIVDKVFFILGHAKAFAPIAEDLAALRALDTGAHIDLEICEAKLQLNVHDLPERHILEALTLFEKIWRGCIEVLLQSNMRPSFSSQ